MASLGQPELQQKVIKRLDVFKGLGKEQLAELMSWLIRVEVPRHKLIIREGAVPNGLFLLCRGDVAVIKGSAKGHLRLNVLQAPSFFGEASLLINGRRSTSIRALTPCMLGKLPKDLLLKKIEEQNLTALLVTQNLARLLAQRLIQADQQLEYLTQHYRRLKEGDRFRQQHA